MGLLEELIKDVPPITRIMCSFSILLTFLTYVDFVTPFNLYFNMNLLIKKMQFWRVFTNLFFFGSIHIHTMFKILLLYRFSRRLEEYSFRGNSPDYFFFILFGIFWLTIFAIIFGTFTMAESLLTMILYLWSKRNRNVFVHIFGLLPMRAPYITWFFVGLQLMIGEPIIYDIVGILIGHVYFYFTDVYPKLPYSKDVFLFKTPSILVKVCDVLHLKGNNVFIDPELAENQNFI